MFTIGVDVGGTYTDLVPTDQTGRTMFAKSPSTPADQSIGVMAGLEELARRLNVSRADMLAATERLVHGTTVATNALLERKGAKVALLTTEGHRDVIEMREGLKPDRYDLRSPPPEPLVPRERRFGVRERLKANGDVLIPLDAKSLDDAIAGIRQSGATSVAVCFLHSYLNPVHELAAVEKLTQALPGISISRSSDVLPQIKEYERVSTTIVNAYVEPVVRLGAESAGSGPGPACFGNGGQAATVTDANVVLGYLDAAAFMGGKRPLDRAASEAAVDRIAAAMELSRDEAAAGVYRMINLNMADGIRLMTLRRGVDPRKFALLSFGGAAGLHAAEVARELEIKRIIVPTVASVLSAWGMLTSDLRYEVSRTHYGAGGRISPDEVRALFDELEKQAESRLRGWFNGPIRIERSAEMRYGEQIFEIDVSLDGLDWSSSSLVDAVEDRFHRRHEELYTYSSPGQEVVFVNARVAAVGEVSQRGEGAKAATQASACKPQGARKAWFGGWRDIPVY